jgi:myo-inositol-1(or 4)-monophosphatase
MALHPMVNVALRAGRRAGQVIVRAMDRVDTLRIEEKQQNDLVSEVDRNAESIIVETLSQAFPDHGIIGEEGGESASGKENVWIIDPLDGTTNFLYGIPHFCISIGMLHQGRLEHAVVIDPVRNEEFVASRGQGAQLNGKRLRVSRRAHLSESLLATGFPFRDNKSHMDAYMGMLREFAESTRGIRRAGAAALDLAYVAAGRYDGYWELGLKPWDLTAGALLVRESGGLVSDIAGGEQFLETGNIVAGSPKVFKAMLQKLRPHLSPALRKG